MRVTDDGQVVLQLQHQWIDGTTHVVFDPVEFLGRLAVLVPRPRINLILYHGVLAPRAAWRSEVVRRQTSGDASGGQPEVLVAVEAPAQVQQPQMLPGGRVLLYTRCVSRRCSSPEAWDAAQVVGRTRTLVWVDRAGREQVISAPPRRYYTLRVSPDGSRVVTYADDGERDLWVWDFARSSLTRLTITSATEMFGVWTPGGRRVVFSSDRRALVWRAADGTGTVERLAESSEDAWPMSISPDGTRLVYMRTVYQSRPVRPHAGRRTAQ